MSEVFRDFALRGVSSLLDQVNQQVRQKRWKPSAPSIR
jgi:CBS domain-containing protein